MEKIYVTGTVLFYQYPGQQVRRSYSNFVAQKLERSMGETLHASRQVSSHLTRHINSDKCTAPL